MASADTAWLAGSLEGAPHERALNLKHQALLPLAQVRCTLTGHEMLPELEICRLYLGGKAYKRALRRRGAPPAAARAQPPRSCADQRRRLRRAELEAFDFAQYEPHIVPHRTDPGPALQLCSAAVSWLSAAVYWLSVGVYLAVWSPLELSVGCRLPAVC